MMVRHLTSICTLLLVFLSAGIAAQDQAATVPRTVQLEPSFPDPIKIVRVLLDGVEVKPGLEGLPSDKPGVPFQAGDEWVNHLTVVLKNVSTKKVVYADIRIFFLDLGDGTPQHPLVGDGNAIGRRPKHARYSTIRGAWQNDPVRDPILIDPGHEFSLPAIGPDRFEEVKEMIESRQPLSSVTRARLGLATVYFE